MPTPRDRWLAIIYAAAIFVSAFLLFQIQPLISKRILPWFGGSPAVWTTCLLFFQTVLFAGYAYAHWTSGWLKPRQQALVHAALIFIALILMHALPSDRCEPSGTEHPIPQILLILATSIGVPYFVLSSTGPLLQAWFAQTFPVRVPYRLYALSNIGSLLALTSYPFLFEPRFDLRSQAQLWTCGFILYAGLCAYIAWRLRHVEPSSSGSGDVTLASSRRGKTTPPEAAGARPHPALYAFWLITASFASLVMIATTNHVSTDIAVMPLLWVVPLAIYLITFIIAFDRPAWYRRTPVAVLTILSIYAAAVTHHFGIGKSLFYNLGTVGLVAAVFGDANGPFPVFNVTTLGFLLANFATLFAVCLLCHGEIVRTRPAPRYLTSFYLSISAGGALGGVFATLVAPLLFRSYFEWDAALFVACLGAIIILIRECLTRFLRADGKRISKSRYALAVAIVLPLLALSLVALIDVTEFLGSRRTNVQWSARDFFGALTVEQVEPDDPLWQRNVLFHGSTTHGSQFTHETRHREPTTYYGNQTGIGRTIDFYHKRLPPGQLRMAVVGLGAGTLAAYPGAGESITYYEINPTVVELAESGKWFTYIRDCRARGAHCDIHLGDARLTLRHELASNSPLRSGEGAGEGHQPYHIIALDAFTGDSIPVHLLTTQAFELYLEHLTGPKDAAGKPTESGAIAVHISSLYLDLEPVVRGIQLRFNLYARRFFTADDPAHNAFDADWIILTHNIDLANDLRTSATPYSSKKPPVLWTDDRSSLFEILR